MTNRGKLVETRAVRAALRLERAEKKLSRALTEWQAARTAVNRYAKLAEKNLIGGEYIPQELS